MVRPSIGAVLNVGVAHVGEFGSQEAIAQAKGELVEGLAPDGLAVLNADDPLVAAMTRSDDGAGADVRRGADRDDAGQRHPARRRRAGPASP